MAGNYQWIRVPHSPQFFLFLFFLSTLATSCKSPQFLIVACLVGAGLEKEMATQSSILAWRTPGTEEPGGLLSMGSHRVGHD